MVGHLKHLVTELALAVVLDLLDKRPATVVIQGHQARDFHRH